MKLAEFAKARWYFGRGLPIGYIAERLNVSPVTVRAWRRLADTDHTFTELRRRVLLLPNWQREQLVTDLVTRRIRRSALLRRAASPLAWGLEAQQLVNLNFERLRDREKRCQRGIGSTRLDELPVFDLNRRAFCRLVLRQTAAVAQRPHLLGELRCGVCQRSRASRL